uniref:Cilia- and flagella-associated protein 45 n=1 Tax=Tetraselmis sp. GSL018 TaxID=582737 RepID=A0A061R424_9CHLO
MSRPVSHAGSAGSYKSTASSKTRYRTVAKGSYVDDTLFGKSGAKTGCKEAPASERTKTPKSKPVPSGRTKTFSSDDVTLVTAKDLERMKGPSPILSAEQQQRLKAEAEAARAEKQAVALQRKEKMLRMEEESKKKVPPTETEKLKMEADAKVLSNAEMARLEELDAVKHMNQMQLYAKCVTIRDAQVEEKKHMMLEEEEEERRLDLMMEIERLKALEHYEERDRARAEERTVGARMLQEQIDEVRQEKVRQDELMAQERAQMNAQLKRLEEEERASREQKKQQARLLMEEVSKANADQIRRKKDVQQREAMEDAQIARYLMEKAAREESEASRQAALKKAKEEEIARLRAQQERAQDKQSELDELRARRYQEAYEREWRQKEAAAAERQRQINDDLLGAREAQKQARLKQMAEQAEAEREEFERILRANREKEAEEAQQAAAQRTIRNRHREELMNQIKSNLEQKRREEHAALEEGRRAADAHSHYVNNLMKVKEMKLSELKDAGVPDKYCAELQSFKVGG